MLPVDSWTRKASRQVEPKTLIVVTLDGLTTSAIGCYGSSWISTPEFDRLASKGVVWDRLIATSTCPAELLSAWWKGNQAWVGQARSRGPVELVTDDASLCSPELTSSFDSVTLIENEARESPAEQIESTSFGKVIAAALQRLSPDGDSHQDHSPPSVLWIHSQFLSTCWDAPRGLAEESWEDDAVDLEPEDPADFSGESDVVDTDGEMLPAWFETAIVPDVELSPRDDPDLVMAWMRTYGCQVRLIDELLTALGQSVRELGKLGSQEPLLVVTSTGGFSLGQNGHIARQTGPLRSCHVQLPLIVNQQGPIRVGAVAGTTMIPGLLQQLVSQSGDWLSARDWSIDNEELSPVIKTSSGSERLAFTSQRWFLVTETAEGSAEGPSEHLFVKPDDSHDANDVSRLRRDIVDELKASAMGN